MSTILAIDTASAQIALALAVDGQIIESSVVSGGHDHSRLLLPAIASVLGERRNSLSGIAVVRGPGNYAGLRVGIATAKGLAIAHAVRIRGISTMEAVTRALDHPTATVAVTVIHPVGRNEFAVQEFRGVDASGPIFALPADQLSGSSLVGEGAEALGGTDVSPEQRVRAALRALIEAFGAPGETPPVDAIYLREPNITVPRRPLNARAVEQTHQPEEPALGTNPHSCKA
ncbi:MAG: tRNA (adenosine(37)-N6)-threonylcarbamoyltransferase complex dimerization subunit type 1 TsaB [Anaerolineaceae bacterium]